MNEYLRLQRRSMSWQSDYHGQLAKIVAKDFAVLARLGRADADGDDGPLRDFFFAGIRGLGTWGAAWYVDREYKALQRRGPDSDIEILLEVTYREGRILNVEDVSERPESYFKEELSPDKIRQAVRAYADSHTA